MCLVARWAWLLIENFPFPQFKFLYCKFLSTCERLSIYHSLHVFSLWLSHYSDLPSSSVEAPQPDFFAGAEYSSELLLCDLGVLWWGQSCNNSTNNFSQILTSFIQLERKNSTGTLLKKLNYFTLFVFFLILVPEPASRVKNWNCIFME